MSKITPCLWFDGKAEEAANFYVSLLPDSRIDTVQRSPADYPAGKAGDVLTVEFTLAGQPFLGVNGGPEFAFTEATSFIINCDDQAEVDRLWDALTKDGQPIQCGWLKDRYGLSWQITPTELPKLLKDSDPEKARRVMEAMMGMIKIDVAALRRAYGGTAAAEEDR
jgi:predicted 3-demethylubiquinone-9 3-methyltransferase (glyoxalase superfamily)